MTNELRQLEQQIQTLAHAVDISVARIGWLTDQARQSATDEELAALERAELTCVFDIAEKGNARDAAVARSVIESLGMTAPDYVPADL